MQKISLTAFILIMITACSGSTPTQFYTLDAVLPTASTAHPQNQKPSVIGIGPITLPALLDRKGMVTRGARQSIQVSDSEQWAEPLLDNITRVIARNLARLKPRDIFHAYPWAAFGPVDKRIVVEVTQFEAQVGKAVYFEAIWSIKSAQEEKIPTQGHSKLARPLKGHDTAEMVTQMNDILANFSRELSRALD